MPDECERIEQLPSFADAFREIHRFILKAMDGNAAAANALFRKYLNGGAAGRVAVNFAKLDSGRARPFDQAGGRNCWGL
jgi:hypothetical protein